MNRKHFIKSASALVGGAVIPSALRASEHLISTDRNQLTLKKGLGFGMIKDGDSVVDKFRLARDLGFDGIEINSPIDISMDALLAAKRKTGIAIPSVVNKDHWSKPLSDPDPSVRQHTIESVIKSLTETKELGGDTVLVVPGVVNERVSYEEAYEYSLGAIRKLIPHAEKTGIKIGLENVWNNFILSPLEARAFIDEIGHPLIGWYFDIGNVLRYGWPEHWLSTLNTRIVKLHAKEFSREIMDNEGLWKGFGVDLLEGSIDWPKVMKTVKEIGYSGEWLIAELTAGDQNYLRKVSTQMDEILSLV